jgi:hypothetical protein
MRRVHVAANPLDAEAVKLHLESEGIPAIVRNDHLWPIAGMSMMLDSAPAVWVVRDEDEQRAREILAAEESPNGAMPAWRCERCHEDNEGAFGVCWKCGAGAPPLKVE